MTEVSPQGLVAALRDVASKWWTPDPKIVSKLPRGGNKDKQTWQNCRVCRGWHAPNSIHLDYVGHADLTRTLIEIDPEWQWEPVAYDDEGLPRVTQRGGMYVLWGRVTLLGKTMLAVGTCETTKLDVDKELVGDMLRNAGMRFGIYGDLWSKVDGWDLESPAETQVSLPPVERSDIALVAPEKPVDDMTVAELIGYGRRIGVPVSGSKTDMQRILKPYAMAATGTEPFEVAESTAAPAEAGAREPNDEANGAVPETVAANPARAAREHLSGTERMARNSAARTERTMQ